MMTNMDKTMGNDISRGAPLPPFTDKIQDADVTMKALSTLHINIITTQAMHIKDNAEIVVDMTCVSKSRYGQPWPNILIGLDYTLGNLGPISCGPA